MILALAGQRDTSSAMDTLWERRHPYLPVHTAMTREEHDKFICDEARRILRASSFGTIHTREFLSSLSLEDWSMIIRNGTLDYSMTAGPLLTSIISPHDRDGLAPGVEFFDILVMLLRRYACPHLGWDHPQTRFFFRWLIPPSMEEVVTLTRVTHLILGMLVDILPVHIHMEYFDVADDIPPNYDALTRSLYIDLGVDPNTYAPVLDALRNGNARALMRSTSSFAEWLPRSRFVNHRDPRHDIRLRFFVETFNLSPADSELNWDYITCPIPGRTMRGIYLRTIRDTIPSIGYRDACMALLAECISAGPPIKLDMCEGHLWYHVVFEQDTHRLPEDRDYCVSYMCEIIRAFQSALHTDSVEALRTHITDMTPVNADNYSKDELEHAESIRSQLLSAFRSAPKSAYNDTA